MPHLDDYAAIVELGKTTTGTTWRFKVLRQRHENFKQQESVLGDEPGALGAVARLKSTGFSQHFYPRSTSARSSNSSQIPGTNSSFDSMSQSTSWSNDTGSNSQNYEMNEMNRRFGTKRIGATSKPDIFLSHNLRNEIEEDVMPSA